MKSLPLLAALLLTTSYSLHGAEAQPVPAKPHIQDQPFVVLIDPAHGGSEQGAKLAPHLLEKDLTLSLSVRLRSALSTRGIAVVTTRDSDTLVPTLERARIANHALAAACITLHATTTGSGVHLFTSSVVAPPATSWVPPPGSPSMGATAIQSVRSQAAASAQQSLRLTSEFNATFAQAEVPVTLGRTSLQPLDAFACPAVAIELAPLAPTALSRGSAISDDVYQAKVIDALTRAIQQWRSDRKP